MKTILAFGLFLASVIATHAADFNHPFAANSIWNTRIGTNATYSPANLGKNYTDEIFSVDTEYFFWTESTDPLKKLYLPDGRAASDVAGFKLFGNFQISNWAWTAPWTSTSTPNNASSVMLPDHHTYFEVQPLKSRSDGNWSGWPVGGDPKNFDILTGSGRKGAHYGSGLSVMGGSLRRVNLEEAQIAHALKINIWGKRYLYRSTPAIPLGQGSEGYRWPAFNADGAFKNSSSGNYYNGSNDQLTMGSLLAIPPSSTLTTSSLQTELGRKLYWTLVHYGAYVVDNSAWAAYEFSVEYQVKADVKTKYGMDLTGSSSKIAQDVMKLIKALHVVTNNYSYNVGGGGIPIP